MNKPFFLPERPTAVIIPGIKQVGTLQAGVLDPLAQLDAKPSRVPSGLILMHTRRLEGEVLCGLSLPFLILFIFNQYGLLAGRISGLTDLGFTGDFSEDDAS